MKRILSCCLDGLPTPPFAAWRWQRPAAMKQTKRRMFVTSVRAAIVATTPAALPLSHIVVGGCSSFALCVPSRHYRISVTTRQKLSPPQPPLASSSSFPPPPPLSSSSPSSALLPKAVEEELHRAVPFANSNNSNSNSSSSYHVGSPSLPPKRLLRDISSSLSDEARDALDEAGLSLLEYYRGMMPSGSSMSSSSSLLFCVEQAPGGSAWLVSRRAGTATTTTTKAAPLPPPAPPPAASTPSLRSSSRRKNSAPPQGPTTQAPPNTTTSSTPISSTNKDGFKPRKEHNSSPLDVFWQQTFDVTLILCWIPRSQFLPLQSLLLVLPPDVLLNTPKEQRTKNLCRILRPFTDVRIHPFLAFRLNAAGEARLMRRNSSDSLSFSPSPNNNAPSSMSTPSPNIVVEDDTETSTTTTTTKERLSAQQEEEAQQQERLLSIVLAPVMPITALEESHLVSYFGNFPVEGVFGERLQSDPHAATLMDALFRTTTTPSLSSSSSSSSASTVSSSANHVASSSSDIMDSIRKLTTTKCPTVLTSYVQDFRRKVVLLVDRPEVRDRIAENEALRSTDRSRYDQWVTLQDTAAAVVQKEPVATPLSVAKWVKTLQEEHFTVAATLDSFGGVAVLLWALQRRGLLSMNASGCLCHSSSAAAIRSSPPEAADGEEGENHNNDNEDDVPREEETKVGKSRVEESSGRDPSTVPASPADHPSGASSSSSSLLGVRYDPLTPSSEFDIDQYCQIISKRWRGKAHRKKRDPNSPFRRSDVLLRYLLDHLSTTEFCSFTELGQKIDPQARYWLPESFLKFFQQHWQYVEFRETFSNSTSEFSVRRLAPEEDPPASNRGLVAASAFTDEEILNFVDNAVPHGKVGARTFAVWAKLPLSVRLQLGGRCEGLEEFLSRRLPKAAPRDATVSKRSDIHHEHPVDGATDVADGAGGGVVEDGGEVIKDSALEYDEHRKFIRVRGTE